MAQPKMIFGRLLRGFAGDLQFWFLTGPIGYAAFIFFFADLAVNIGYLTQLSMFAGKTWWMATLGGLIGAGVSFWVHFGLPYTWRQPLWIVRVPMLLFVVAMLGTGGWLAQIAQIDLYNLERENEAAAVSTASSERELAASERNTEIEQAAADRAKATLDTASTRRGRAEQWQQAITACSIAQAAPDGGAPCQDVMGIQVALNIRRDGLPRSETANAVASELAEARREESAAEATYRSALADLTEKQALIERALQREGRADRLENERSYLRTVRDIAEDNLGLVYTLGPAATLTPEQTETNATIAATAERYVKESAMWLAVIIVGCSFFFGLFRMRLKHDDDVWSPLAESPPAHGQKALPAPDPDAPLNDGAQVSVGKTGTVIDDEAPYNPRHESRHDARRRLDRANARIEAVLAADTDDELDVEEARLKEKLADKLERDRKKARIAALRRDLGEEVDAEYEDLGSPSGSRSSNVEEEHWRRRSSGSAQQTAPQGGVDIEDAINRAVKRALEENGPKAEAPVDPKPEPEVAAKEKPPLTDEELAAKVKEFEKLKDQLQNIHITIQNHPNSPEAARARVEATSLQGRVHVLRDDILVEDKRRRHVPRRDRQVPLK